MTSTALTRTYARALTQTHARAQVPVMRSLKSLACDERRRAALAPSARAGARVRAFCDNFFPRVFIISPVFCLHTHTRAQVRNPTNAHGWDASGDSRAATSSPATTGSTRAQNHSSAPNVKGSCYLRRVCHVTFFCSITSCNRVYVF